MRSAALTGTVASAAMAIAVMASLGPSVARAQAKDLRVGAIGNPSSPAYAFAEGAFLKGMAHFGYERGRNFTFEHVAHSGSTQAEYDRGYRQLVGRKVDIFVAFGLEELLKAAIAVAGTRPIVMIAMNWDPLARGYVRSLARPGGNITGVTFRSISQPSASSS